jgi:hypothetical protein
MGSRTKSRLLLLVALFGGFALTFAQPAAARAPDLKALEPGATKTYELTVPVNIVFVGFTKQQFNESDLRAILPASYKPVPVIPTQYDQALGTSNARDLGLNYTFEYDFEYTDDDFEDDFFGYLQEIGEEGAPTYFQQCYSGTAPPVEDVPDPCNQVGAKETIDESLYIDGPKVEKWLSENAPDDVDVETKAYTLYLVNWYGRDDFRFHVYTKTDQPDPDTGYNFGVERPSRKMIAWGGTHSRGWLYDFSAGPESWAGNYDINNPDLDFDAQPDYRIPPIWEYAADGYRAPAALGSDMGLLARYVAINLLFTTSPIYDPLVTTPGPDGRKVVSINVLQQDPAVDGADYVDASYIRRELRSFEPYYRWKVDVNEDPIDAGAERALRVFLGLEQQTPADCSTEFGDTFPELYCYFNNNLGQYVPEYDEDDYVGPVFAFNTTDELGDVNGLLGYAENNYIDGTQTYVFEFDAPFTRELGYGFSTTTVHEFGHHIGMPHPHDGWDAATATYYDPTGDRYFAWSGDESNTIMSYIDLSLGFGRFDRDNLYRWEAAGYLNASNALLAQILANPNAGDVDDAIEDADGYARNAERSLQSWNFLTSARSAYKAYNTLRDAAEELGIDTSAAQTNAAAPLQPGVVQTHVDPVHPNKE